MSKYKTTHLSPSEIDHLRFKAFATNGQEDMAAYYRAASLYFQERDVRAMNRADRIEELKAKLAEAERVARYETDIAEQALDQMKAEKARAESAEANLAKVEEDRDDALIALASARKQLELYIEEAEAALPTVYLLGLADAAWVAAGIASQYVGYMSRVEKGICALPTPTAAELMARIHTGEKE